MTRWIKVTNGERSGRSKVVYLHASTGSRKYPRLRLPVRYEGYVENLIPAGSARTSRIKGIVDKSGLQVRRSERASGRNRGNSREGRAGTYNPFVGHSKRPYSRWTWTLRRSGARGKLNDKIWCTCLLAASCRGVPLSSVRRLACLNILHQSQSSSAANQVRYDPKCHLIFHIVRKH